MEIYSIKLPSRPVDVGEGKPENQNHAIVFTRGETLQTIDMNQITSHLFYLILHYKVDILCDKGIFDKEIRLINEYLEADDIYRTVSLIETDKSTSPM